MMCIARRAILAMALTLVPLIGTAAVLIEATVGEGRMRLISDDRTGRLLLAGIGVARLVDLRSQSIYFIYGDRPAEKIYLGNFVVAEQQPAGFEVEKLGTGPRIAGYPTTSFELRIGPRVCSQIDANLGLMMQLDTAIKAIELLDRMNTLVKGDARSPCEQIPYRRYKRIGWGLRVHDENAAPIETTAIDTAYQPQAGEIDLPATAVDRTEQFWSNISGPAAE